MRARWEMEALGPVQIGIIVLTLATALIHIVLAIPQRLLMFYLNGVGYVALLVALFAPPLPPFRRLTRWTLLGYAALTVLLWVRLGERSLTAYIDKLIEVALIGMLWVEERQSSSGLHER